MSDERQAHNERLVHDIALMTAEHCAKRFGHRSPNNN